MKNTNWREIVEIVGVVSIVGSLLLLAMEVRQSNQIAATEMEVSLSQGYMTNQFERASNPEYAKLFAKMSDPDSHLITATERQQIRGIAWHYVNVYWVAQVAYDNGVISDEQIAAYSTDLEKLLIRHPGLVEHFVYIYKDLPYLQQKQVFAPIAAVADTPDKETSVRNQ